MKKVNKFEADRLYFSLKSLGLIDWPVSHDECLMLDIEGVLNEVEESINDYDSALGSGIRAKRGIGELYDLAEPDKKIVFGWEFMKFDTAYRLNNFIVYLVEHDEQKNKVKYLDDRRDKIVEKYKKWLDTRDKPRVRVPKTVKAVRRVKKGEVE